MSRLAAKTDADREMHQHLSAATTSVRKALAVVARNSPQDFLIRRRSQAITRKLKGILGLLEGIGTVQPGWDLTDPDLLPEDQKVVRERAVRPPPQVPGPGGEDEG